MFTSSKWQKKDTLTRRLSVAVRLFASIDDRRRVPRFHPLGGSKSTWTTPTVASSHVNNFLRLIGTAQEARQTGSVAEHKAQHHCRTHIASLHFTILVAAKEIGVDQSMRLFRDDMLRHDPVTFAVYLNEGHA